MADERNKKDNNELNRWTMNTLCLLLIMCTNLESLATDITIAKISKHKKNIFRDYFIWHIRCGSKIHNSR